MKPSFRTFDSGQPCPRCGRRVVVRLRRMARYSSLIWFKCDGCDHLFTRPNDDVPPLNEGAPGSSGATRTIARDTP